MNITRTIELTDEERVTVSRFLKITDDIATIARCSMDEVFQYFVDTADLIGDGYSIDNLHQIDDIG